VHLVGFHYKCKNYSKRTVWTKHVPCLAEMRNTHTTVFGNREGKRKVGMTRHQLEYNIKMDLKEVKWKGDEWLCNKNQLDALFILSLFHQSVSTYFRHIRVCSPSSGGIMCIYNPANRQSTKKHNMYQLYIYSIPPDDGLQICPKHVEVAWWNKLWTDRASVWFLLHSSIEMHGQQNIKCGDEWINLGCLWTQKLIRRETEQLSASQDGVTIENDGAAYRHRTCFPIIFIVAPCIL